MPTLHLEKIAEMQGDEWIQKIQDDEAFTYDSLIQDEKFLEAVRRGEIRHVRLSGHKLAPLGMDTGEFELGGGDGVSYGDLSMKDFTKNMLAMATYTYDKSSPLKKTPIFERDPIGNRRVMNRQIVFSCLIGFNRVVSRTLHTRGFNLRICWISASMLLK